METSRNQAQVGERVAFRARRRPKRIKGVLVDVAGTLYVGKEALPGCSDALRRLRESHVQVVFASNSSKESSATLADKLRCPAAELIATSRSKYLKVDDGGMDIGLGAFVAALEFSTGKSATITGKPEASFFELGMKKLGTLPEETAVVGDDVHDDVNAGQDFGLYGLLVKTGKYQPEDENGAARPPDATVRDFVAAVDWMLGER
eukprot:jgi/Pico_ML_1/52700/g3373.t1